MGIKCLDKSHRAPVSCKEISREQVANRSRSQCKQGLTDMLHKSVGSTVGIRVGRCVSHGRDTTSV